MATTTSSAWTSRPALARCIRITAALLPTGVSFFVTYGLVQQLPPHEAGIPKPLWWLGLFVIGTVVLIATDKVARRLLPLVALFKLSLVFPDQAPSRYSIAMKTGTTKQLERRIAELQRDGIPNDEAQFATIMLELVASLSVHDRMTRGHCERVRAYTDLVIEELGIHEPDASRLRWAALLHDVGKLFVDPSILNSPNRPTNEQWEELKSHTWQGDRLIGPLKPWLGEWHRAVGEHHERWDGGGYPNALAGTDIHLGARIVAVTDAFDVMTSARSYKKPIPAEEARAEIARCANGQFDPAVVRAFLNIGLGRLRLAIGPLAWLANIPAAGQASLAPALSPIATGATAAATVALATISGGFGGAFVPDAEPPESLALVGIDAAESAQVESPTTTVVTTAAPTTAPQTITTPTTATPTTATPTTATSATGAPTTAPPTPALPTTALPTLPPTTVSVGSPSTTAPATTVPVTTAPAPTTTTTQPPDQPPPSAPPPEPPMAYALSRTIDEDDGPRSLTISATATGDLTWRIAAQPGKGIATLTPPPSLGAGSSTPIAQFATLVYEPAPDQFGTDALVFEVCDDQKRCDSGAVTISIAPAPDGPAAAADSLPAVDEDTTSDLAADLFLGNDRDVDGEVLSIGTVEALGGGTAAVQPDGTIRYVPAANDDTEDTIRYEACDPTGRCDSALAILDITPTPDDPIAAQDLSWTTEDTPLVLGLAGLLSNDSDPDGDALEIRSASTTPGTATLDPLAGQLTFTPQANDDTQQTVYYEVCDPTDRCDFGWLTIDIIPVNDPPVVAQASDQSHEPGDELTISITASDIEGDAFRFEATGLPPGTSFDETTGLISGTLTAAAAGETYTVSVTAIETRSNPATSEPMDFDLVVDLGDSTSPLTRSLIISEVLYRSSPGVHDEFVEITNIGDAPVDLTGLQVLDQDPNDTSRLGWVRTLGTTDSRSAPSVLAVGQTAVVWVNNPLQSGRSFPDAPAGALTYRGPSNSIPLYSGVFATPGEDIWLTDASGDVIDYVAYESSPPAIGSQILSPPPEYHWVGPEFDDLASAAAGQSISLAVPGRNVDPGCWERTGSGDAAGRCAGAAPTQQINTVAGDIRIASIGQANYQ